MMRQFYRAHSKEISGITLINRSGFIAYTYPYENFTGSDLTHQPHIRKMMNTEKPIISGIFVTVQGFRSTAFNIPIFRNDTYQGAISILVPFDNLGSEYLAGIHVLDGTGNAWMISPDGTILYSPAPELVGRNVNSLYNTSTSVPAMTGEAIAGKTGIMTYTRRNPAGSMAAPVTYQAAFVPVHIADTSWSVIVATPESEIVDRNQGVTNILALITLILISSIALFAIYATREIQAGREK